jgi:hypothetical protein
MDGEHVRVEQSRLNARGLLEPMPPVDATVVAWSCDGMWSAEASVDSDGHAVFQPPDGLDCWNLTAVDLHFAAGGGASTVLRAPIPFEGAIVLPAGFPTSSSASRPGVEVSGRVLGLPEGTDAVEVTGNVSIAFDVSGPPQVVGSEAHFVGRISHMPPDDALHITALAMRDGFPIHGAADDFALPTAGGLSIELALPETPARVEQAELTMRVPDVPYDLFHPEAEGPVWHDGSVYLEGNPGGRVGHIRLEQGAGSDWMGEARWVAVTEGDAILSPYFGWANELIEEDVPFIVTTLRARGSVEALSVMTVPDISDQRIRIEASPDSSQVQLEASVGHEDLVARLVFRANPHSSGRAWLIEGFGPGKVELDDWPRLPSGSRPEEMVGTEPTRVWPFTTLRTSHEAGPNDPASFRIVAPEVVAGIGVSGGM